jgi:CheY-like chemotaxis protein
MQHSAPVDHGPDRPNYRPSHDDHVGSVAHLLLQRCVLPLAVAGDTSGPSSIVLIALTGWGQGSDKRRAMDAGFDHHLIKPVDPDQLSGLIDSGS